MNIVSSIKYKTDSTVSIETGIKVILNTKFKELKCDNLFLNVIRNHL